MNTKPNAGAAPASPNAKPEVSPSLLFDTITAYQKSAAIKAAIELDVFSAFHGAPATAATLAERTKSSPRGIRILSDYLVLLGFLRKTGEQYSLTPDSAVFLDRKSPAYAGGTLEFLLEPGMREAFDQLTTATRNGRTARSGHGTMEPDHPVWISFARSMGPLMGPAANGLSELVRLDANRATKVLDISASHGTWGLAFAKRYPKANVIGLDWAPVLEVAKKNAAAAGVGDRYSTIVGSAFEKDFGNDLDVVLLPNFLHHFDAATNVKLLKKAHAAIRPGGTVAVVEFVPNPDRVSPPMAAGFSLVMLANTEAGDAYTFAEISDMLKQAGFKQPTQHSLPASVNLAVLATK